MRMHTLGAALLAAGVLAFAGTAGAQSMSRSEVREVQRALNNAGYDIAVDGVWGPNSRRALSDYQRNNNLNVTGRADRDTMAAMNIDSPRRMTGSSGSTVRRGDSPSTGGAAGITHMGSEAKGSRTKTDTLTNPRTVPVR